MNITNIKAAIPRPMRRRLAFFPYMFSVMRRLRGSQQKRECNICGYIGRFATFGHPPRYDVECRRCGSLERHRLLKYTFDKTDLLVNAKRVLHFAPEPMVSKLIPKRIEYVTADIRPGRADLVLNLEEINQPNESVDVIIANHVLEHVDDQKALSELRRILRSGGSLVATIPIVEGWDETYEDPRIATDRERVLHFGQGDHIRVYGRDFRDRIKDTGFELREYSASGAETVRFRFRPGERVFIATKPSS
jgi:SAM-dependent methyltransferase